MGALAHWLTAHGVARGPGKYFGFAFIGRKRDIQRLIDEWNAGIIWC